MKPIKQTDQLPIFRRICRKMCNVFMYCMPDRLYLELLYYVRLNKKLNLRNPQTFNEKINWLKLYDRNLSYTCMADKYEVRKYISERIGEDYLIPLLGVWNSVDDIPFEELPNQFVLKCTHDSGSVIICKDKNNFDKESAKKKLNEAMKTNFFYQGREWPYKNIIPRIVAEKYMLDESGIELKDYKIFNFNGKPYLIQVDFGRFTKHERNLYSTSWKYIDEQIEYPGNPTVIVKRPENLDIMLSLSKKLAKNIPFVRTDFYSICGKIYFGEITFYHGSGFEKFSSFEFEKKLGTLIVLPRKKSGEL